MGAVRVAFAVIQPGGVGRGVPGGVLDGREPLAAVEQDRDERVSEPVGVHPVDLAVLGAEQPGVAGELDQQPADGLLGVVDARCVVAVPGATVVLALEQHAALPAGGDGADRAGGSLVERDAGELAALALNLEAEPAARLALERLDARGAHLRDA